MCMICIDLARRKLRPLEARRALQEMREALDKEHVAEVESQLDELEAEHEAPTRP